jgi:hypothetical protein
MAEFDKLSYTGTQRMASAKRNSSAKEIGGKPMTTQKLLTPRFAICINNSEYPASLELHKVYRVLPDKEAERDGDVRIIDESGEDYLFPADYFELVALTPHTVRALKKSYSRVIQRAT